MGWTMSTETESCCWLESWETEKVLNTPDKHALEGTNSESREHQHGRCCCWRQWLPPGLAGRCVGIDVKGGCKSNTLMSWGGEDWSLEIKGSIWHFRGRMCINSVCDFHLLNAYCQNCYQGNYNSHSSHRGRRRRWQCHCHCQAWQQRPDQLTMINSKNNNNYLG